jgi:SAM-dependent methyltransferase
VTLHEPAVINGRACPNCSAPASEPAVLRADDPAELLSREKLADRWRGFFSSPCFFTYHRCSSCEQLFCSSYLSDATLAEFYSAMSDNIHSGDPTSSEETQADYADMIARVARKADRYLEIGPDIGLLARALQKRLPIKRAFLVEPNRTVWPQLTEAFPAGVANLAVDIKEFEDKIPDAGLDLVVGVHVLDHLTQPHAVLQWIARKLAPGGVVAIVVHNERSLLARALGRRWPAYCLQHPQLFNPQTLTSMLERNGFTAAAILPAANRLPLGYLLTHGAFASFRLKLELGFLHWPVRLRLGNIMGLATKR